MKKTTIALFVSALMLPFLSGCGEAKAGSQIPGTYKFDNAAIVKAIEAKEKDAPAEVKPMIGMLKETMGKVKMTLILTEDGKGEQVATGPDGKEQKSACSWKLEGDKFSMTGMSPQGVEQTMSGTCADGVIKVMAGDKPEEQMELVFKKEEKK